MLRHVADQTSNRPTLAHHMMSHHCRGSFRWLEQAKKDLHQRALARAIRADEAGNSRFDYHGERVECRDAAEPPRECVRDDEGDRYSGEVAGGVAGGVA